MPIDDELESDDFLERSFPEDDWTEGAPEFLDPVTLGLAAGATKILDPLLRGTVRRTPFQRVRTGPGVQTARLNTPSGPAELRLPSKVATIEQHKALEALVNAHSGRLNAIHRDVEALRKQVATVVSDVTRQISRSRQEQGNGAMMSMMMAMMAQQSQRDDLESHTHSPPGGPAVVPDGGGDMFMMLPMMLGMTGQGGGGDDGNTLMLAMAMMMMNRDNDD